MPKSNTTAIVNNGPSSTYGNIWVSAKSPVFNIQVPITINLLNNSASNAVLAHATTLPNGTAEFKNVSSSYNYQATGDTNQSATSIIYDFETSATPVFTVASKGNITQYVSVWESSRISAKVVGTAVNPANNQWGMATDTTVSNGTFDIGTAATTSGGPFSLTFYNTSVLFNDTVLSSENFNIIIENSIVTFENVNTVIAYVPYAHLVVKNSIIYLPNFVSTYNQQYALNWSVINSTIVGGGSECTQIGGSYTNSTVYDVASYPTSGYTHSVANFTQSSVLNSTLTWNYDLNMSHSLVQNSLIYDWIGGPCFINNSVLNSAQWDFSTSSNPSAEVHGYNDVFNLTRGYFSLSGYQYMAMGMQGNATGSINSISSILLNRVDLRFIMPTGENSTEFYSASRTLSMAAQTVIINNSFVAVNITPFPDAGIGGNTLFLNNDYFDQFTNLSAQVGYLEGLTSSFNPLLDIVGHYKTTISYSMFSGVNMFLLSGGNPPGQSASLAYSHDIFENYVIGSARSNIGGPSTNPNFNGVISNSTFKNVLFNATVYDKSTANYPYVGLDWSFIGNSGLRPPRPAVNNYWSYIHNTFDSFIPGPTTALGSGGVLWLANQETQFNITDNLFKNSPAYSKPVSFQNGSYYTAPYTSDIDATTGYTTITGNWFLNLSNQTLPIVGSGSSDVGGASPILNITNNHFYWSPPILSSIIPFNRTTNIIQAYGPKDYRTGNPTISGIGYELPLDTNGTLYTISGNNQYLYNTTITQNNSYGGAGSGGISEWGLSNTEFVYSWVFCPDVNTLSGTPTISYSNGLVGGPQPNFTWQGYKYTESVEPSYISVGANSTKAPPVDLQFQTSTPGTLRTVDIYENGALWGNETVRANTQGVVTVSYDPSTQPLDPIFSLVPLTSSPPPPLPPAIVHAPDNVRLFLFVAAAGFGGFMLAAIAAYTLTGSKKGRKRQL